MQFLTKDGKRDKDAERRFNETVRKMKRECWAKMNRVERRAAILAQKKHRAWSRAYDIEWRARFKKMFGEEAPA